MPGLPTANMLLRLITVLLALCQPLAVNSQKDGIVRIGVLMLQGSWSTLSSWNATFNTFLNAQLGASTGLYFNASVVSYANSFSAIKNQDLDFWFGDPLAFSCLELESALDPVATVIMSRGGKTTPSLSGSAFVSGNSTISSVLDLKGKVIASASFFNPNVLSPFLSFQNQGLNFYADPAQLIYGLGNVPIVNMVLSGQADVGIMSGGTLENMVYLHQLNRSSFRFLAPETAVDSYDPAYPFTHNGPLMPGWILSALPHVNASLTTKVQAALTTLNSGSPAARAGGFSSFTPPRSYAIMFRIARALNWFKDTMSNEQLTQCSVRSDAGFAPITCPEGWYKIPDIDIANSCNQPGALPCPSGLSCVCNPCREIAKEPFTLRLVQIDSQPIGSISNTTIQCAKMEICIQIQQLQSLTFQVVDNLYAARGTLGLANISRVSWRGNVGEDWEFIPANESVSPGVSSFTFKPLQLGAHVVSVAVDGEEIPGSPTLLQERSY